MAPGRKRNNKAIPIGEHVRITIDIKLREFLNAHDQVELEFPNFLSSVERAYVHNLVKKHGLKSKSKGKGDDRFLTIYKRDGSTIVQADAKLTLSKQSFQAIHNLLSKYSLTPKEKSDVAPTTQKIDISNNKSHNKDLRSNTGRLNEGIPLIPEISSNPELESFRKALPVSLYKTEIMDLLKENQVILISGETGSGKTTQIPQFILDEASRQNQKCRIICTQPRRLAAISICERVARERNVRVGQGVGYQIRLESRVSPHTGLIYCTTGVLLRTLMGSENCISNITHIIIDEIHERDKFSDYLLIVIRDCLSKHPTLRLILMSATIDTDIFQNYFKKCPIVKIPGRLYPVQSYFLEDVLKMTNYSNKDMKKFASLLQKKQDQQEMQENLMRSFRKTNIGSPETKDLNRSSDTLDITDDLKELMDNSLHGFWMNASVDHFTQILHLILTENVSVNYQHSSIGCTILMLTAGRGLTEHTEQILNLGADSKLRSCNNWTAYDWAIQSGHTECAQLILAYTDTNVESVSKQNYELEHQASSPEDKELLEAYSHSFNADEEIDHDLILHIIVFIHTLKSEGGILVFLPGYEDIINLRDLILKESKMQEKPYQLFILHSNMHTIDHKQVFDKLNGIRKIILSTNIAQTSITINDVVFVIDSGKVKEVSFDGVSGTTCLRSNWISRACAVQRAGRAGRVQPGECFHLFSRIRYIEMMQKFTTPDILRTPLQELCLQTKLLAPINMPIADFLARAVEPPPSIVTKQAIQLLKTMGALNDFEDLTEMGVHLVDIPLDPKLAKMLIYSVVLKCLDPVLTIVSSLAHKDPFIIPSQPSDKRALALSRKQFSADTFSDHMVFLRVFQEWQKARQGKYEKQFCVKNFLNSATMEQIVNTRLQLLGQLRASGFVKARGYYDVKDLNLYSENWAVVKAAVTASLYPTLCRIDREFMTLRTQNENKVLFHPSSSLRSGSNPYKHKPSTSLLESLKSAPSEWMVYEEKSRVGPWCYIKTVTMITPIMVALFGGPIRAPETMVSKDPPIQISSDSDSESEQAQTSTENKTDTFSVDNWAIFRSEIPVAEYVYDLRRKWNSLFISRMSNPSKTMAPSDEAVLETVVKVLSQEEAKAGFVQPPGIGQRPKALTTEDMSPTIYQNFAQHKMTPSRNRNTVDGSNYQKNCRQQSNNCNHSNSSGIRLKKYFIFKMIDGNSGKSSHRSDFRITDELASSFREILQAGGHVYLIFISKNRPNFEGVAEVIDRSERYNNCGGSSQGKVIQLNWLSRLPVPVSASGLGTSINMSTVYDGLELEGDYGKALMDYLISYKPSFYKNN